jgi:hypothetical protein
MEVCDGQETEGGARVTRQLQQVIAAACALPPREKLELLGVISRDLQKVYALTEESAAFWSPRTIDEIVQNQAAPVISDVRTLAVDFWPEDECADDLSQFIARQRRTDLTADA